MNIPRPRPPVAMSPIVAAGTAALRLRGLVRPPAPAPQLAAAPRGLALLISAAFYLASQHGDTDASILAAICILHELSTTAEGSPGRGSDGAEEPWLTELWLEKQRRWQTLRGLEAAAARRTSLPVQMKTQPRRRRGFLRTFGLYDNE